MFSCILGGICEPQAMCWTCLIPFTLLYFPFSLLFSVTNKMYTVVTKCGKFPMRNQGWDVFGSQFLWYLSTDSWLCCFDLWWGNMAWWNIMGQADKGHFSKATHKWSAPSWSKSPLELITTPKSNLCSLLCEDQAFKIRIWGIYMEPKPVYHISQGMRKENVTFSIP